VSFAGVISSQRLWRGYAGLVTAIRLVVLQAGIETPTFYTSGRTPTALFLRCNKGKGHELDQYPSGKASLKIKACKSMENRLILLPKTQKTGV
jgi:hypothetical protein